eukprot:GABV01005992.1.p1 GENE.GABV01005992.1~~GABV01005992.1.p1  ORF type:complete len:119 (-),score=28.50 GABV01005992.1:3-359(-)
MAEKEPAPVPGTAVPVYLGDSFFNNPSSSFHYLRYRFRPSSVDLEAKGTLTVKPSNTMELDMPTTDETGAHFIANVEPATETECVLIYDGECFLLEMLSSKFKIRHEHSRGGKARLDA